MTETRQGHEGRAHENFFIGFLAELDNSKSFGKISFLAFFGLYGLFGLIWRPEKKISLNNILFYIQ